MSIELARETGAPAPRRLTPSNPSVATRIGLKLSSSFDPMLILGWSTNRLRAASPQRTTHAGSRGGPRARRNAASRPRSRPRATRHKGATEIHPHLHAWIGPCSAPERNLDYVEKLPIGFGRRYAVSLEQFEMDLVHVKLMIFPGPVFNGPILDRSLGGRDCWRVV
jgi:hypothetical protein